MEEPPPASAPVEEKKPEPVPSPLGVNEKNPFLGNRTLADCLQEQGAETDSTGQYTTRPLFASQLETEPKLSNIQITVFDLSKTEDLMKYQAIKTRNINPGSGLAILSEERKWSEKNENWKIFVESATILYKLPQNLITRHE